MLLPSSWGGSVAVSLTESRSNSESSRLSKNSLLPTRCTMMSQEYTDLVQHISVARIASVANTLPLDLASQQNRVHNIHSGHQNTTMGLIMSNLVEQYFKSCNHKKQMFDRKKYGRHLSDNRVISGGDFMEHPVYPLHSFLILCCHSIILLIIVFHATTFQSTIFFFKFSENSPFLKIILITLSHFQSTIVK